MSQSRMGVIVGDFESGKIGWLEMERRLEAEGRRAVIERLAHQLPSLMPQPRPMPRRFWRDTAEAILRPTPPHPGSDREGDME